MSNYSTNAQSWFGAGWTTYVKVAGAPPAKNTGADRAFPNGQYGIMIPQVYGKGRVNGNILWYGEATEVPSAATLTGGTAASPEYQGTFAVAICKGAIVSVVRIWADDLLVYDSTVTGLSSVYGSVTIYLGDEAQTPDSVIESFEGEGNVPGYRGLAYIVFTDLPLKDFGSRIPAFSFEVQAQTSASVTSILNAMAAQTGLEGSDYDFGCIDADVTGYIAKDRVPAKQHVDQLLSIFSGDLVEFDGKLQVIARGQSALATIPDADLGAKVWNGSDKSPAAAITVTRLQDVELPFRLDLNYYSADKGYDPTTTFAVRYDKPEVQNLVTVDCGLVLTEDQARAIAERMLYQRWIERTSFAFSLMPRYLRYVPAAVLYLPVDGEEIRVRVVQMDLGLFGPIGTKAVLDDLGILIQGVPGASVKTDAPALANPVTTSFYAFGGVEFSDADALTPGFYVAATGPVGWRSAELWYSADAGASYAKAATMGAKAVFGHAATVLADGTTADAVDTVSTVQVVLDTLGTLSSASATAVQGGVNWALVGGELLGFQTATLVDAPTRTYTLSHLLRGLRSTPMTGHIAGEKFVLVTSAVKRITVPAELVGSNVLVKAAMAGIPLSAVGPQSVLITANHAPYLTSEAATSLIESTLAETTGSVDFPTWITREIPAGVIDGSNADFAVAFTPVLGTEQVYLNGLLQESGGEDYAIAGDTITFVNPPLSGDRVLVSYMSSAGSASFDLDGPSLDFSKSLDSMYLPALRV